MSCTLRRIPLESKHESKSKMKERDISDVYICVCTFFFFSLSMCKKRQNTREKKLAIFDQERLTNRRDLKFERRPRSCKEDPQIPPFIALPRATHVDSSYPEGNFGGNQLLDGSMSLSPLYSDQAATICTSVPHNASFHQVFTWLHHVRAKFTIFRVSTERL